MLDTSGNIASSAFLIVLTTPALDETPPAIIENTLIEKTDTTANFHLVISELLNRVRIRYRIVGFDLWDELTLNPGTLAFNITLTDLLSGQEYEYQYILEDNRGNQFITEWVRV